MLSIAFKLLFITVAGSAVLSSYALPTMVDDKIRQVNEMINAAENYMKEHVNASETTPIRCNCNLPECLAKNIKDIKVCTSSVGCFVVKVSGGAAIFGCQELMPVGDTCIGGHSLSAEKDKKSEDIDSSTPVHTVRYNCCNQEFCNNFNYVQKTDTIESEYNDDALKQRIPLYLIPVFNRNKTQTDVDIDRIMAYMVMLDAMIVKKKVTSEKSTAVDGLKSDKDVTANSAVVTSTENAMEKETPRVPSAGIHSMFEQFLFNMANPRPRVTEKTHTNSPCETTTKISLDASTGSGNVNAATNNVDSTSTSSALFSASEKTNAVILTPVPIEESLNEQTVEIIPNQDKWFGIRNRRSVTTEANVKPSVTEPVKKVILKTPEVRKRRVVRCIGAKYDPKMYADIGFGIGLCG